MFASLLPKSAPFFEMLLEQNSYLRHMSRLVPLIGGGSGLQLAYSVLFFAAAFLVALRPEKLTNYLS